MPRGKNGVVTWSVRGHGEYCTYCRREMVAYSLTHPTRDHVVPRSKGGKRTVLACATCNHMKGDMMPNEWQEFMSRFPFWWTMNRAEIRGRAEKMGTRRGRIPTSVPKAYDDPEQQRGFENVYRNRLWLLRVDNAG
jgi:hypothetical protein